CLLLSSLSTPYLTTFSFNCSPTPRDLHSFPTRRSSDLVAVVADDEARAERAALGPSRSRPLGALRALARPRLTRDEAPEEFLDLDRKSTRLNSSHVKISYAVFCLKKKKKKNKN